MKMKILIVCIFLTAFLAGCGTGTASGEDRVNNAPAPAEAETGDGGSGLGGGAVSPTPTPAKAESDSELKTVKDHFMALPEEYFLLEGCDRAKDKDCLKAKRDYLNYYLEVDDTKNGYLKAGCDGAQSCIEMAIFRKPDNTYMIAVATSGEYRDKQQFLAIRNGKWVSVAKEIIPEHGNDKIYVIPRQGTKMSVYAKIVSEKGEDYEIAEQGKKLYDLVWKNGKFSRQ